LLRARSLGLHVGSMRYFRTRKPCVTPMSRRPVKRTVTRPRKTGDYQKMSADILKRARS
jgi:hypothetical protein